MNVINFILLIFILLACNSISKQNDQILFVLREGLL